MHYKNYFVVKKGKTYFEMREVAVAYVRKNRCVYVSSAITTGSGCRWKPGRKGAAVARSWLLRCELTALRSLEGAEPLDRVHDIGVLCMETMQNCVYRYLHFIILYIHKITHTHIIIAA